MIRAHSPPSSDPLAHLFLLLRFLVLRLTGSPFDWMGLSGMRRVSLSFVSSCFSAAERNLSTDTQRLSSNVFSAYVIRSNAA
ncbi:hypothetical protein FB451DRAFT_1226007 [Mycena latifolia]|nr:hypothetical protein FB451DRAFT_1226007 [Mycena latifolia]